LGNPAYWVDGLGDCKKFTGVTLGKGKSRAEGANKSLKIKKKKTEWHPPTKQEKGPTTTVSAYEETAA